MYLNLHKSTLLQLQAMLIEKNKELIAFIKLSLHTKAELFDKYDEYNHLREEISLRRNTGSL